MSKRILFHICCGPCATATLKKLLLDGWDVEGVYYNPNIHPSFEYKKRLREAIRITKSLNIPLHVAEYEPKDFFGAVKGKETQFGNRCINCWELRLEKVSEMAQERDFLWFGSTLRISPYQDQEKLLALGKRIAGRRGLQFYEEPLTPHFKESVRLSRDHKMYRQKYCGCIFSREYR